MLTDLLDRINAALNSQVEQLGGSFAKATDRAEAETKAIRDMGNKWLCFAWVASGDAGNNEDLARKGFCDCDLFIAVSRKPSLDVQRDKKVTDVDDDLSLLNLWDRVRGLVYRIRFGTLSEGGEEGTINFQPRDGYLNGHQPMAMQKFTIERKMFEISQPGAPAKQMKELLWAESVWSVKLALPAYAENVTDLSKWWLCV